MFTRRFPVLALVVSSLAFALMALAVRVASARGYGTFELVFWRMAIGAIATYPLMRREGATAAVVNRWLLAVRVLTGALAILTYFWSLQLLPIGLATLFNYLAPLLTTLFAAQFLGERPSSRLLAGIAVALAGAALTLRAVASGSAGVSQAAGALGTVVGLVSAVLQGAAVTMVRQLRRTESTATIFFWFALTTALVCLPFAAGRFHRLVLSDLGLLLAVGLSSLVAQLMFTGALGHVGAATYALVAPTTPLLAFILGVLVLGEPLTPSVVLGGVIVIAGVALGTVRPVGPVRTAAAT